MPGERTAESVAAVVEDFKRRTGGRLMDLITTDGYPAYEEAILEAYGETVMSPATKFDNEIRTGSLIITGRMVTSCDAPPSGP